jgi:hypothetical protein
MAGATQIDEGAVGLVSSPALRGAIGDYATEIGGHFGADLLGMVLYGAVLDAGFDERRSAATSAVVLRHIELETLRRLGEQGVRWGRRGIAAPLVLTPEFIESSCDSFPLELLEIKQNHVTLVGEDHFTPLELKREHVRLQCERELKRIKMRMRQGLLAAAGRDALLAELEADIGLHVVRTMRGMLWLKKMTTYLPAPEVIAKCAELAGRPLASLREALQRKEPRGWEAYSALYADVEALAELANRE